MGIVTLNSMIIPANDTVRMTMPAQNTAVVVSIVHRVRRVREVPWVREVLLVPKDLSAKPDPSVPKALLAKPGQLVPRGLLAVY